MRKTVALLVVLIFLATSCLTVYLPVKAESQTIVVPEGAYSQLQLKSFNQLIVANLKLIKKVGDTPFCASRSEGYLGLEGGKSLESN